MWFCEWHTLCKEAAYGIGDLDPDKDWKKVWGKVELDADDLRTIEGFRKRGIERLTKLAKYAIENK